MLDSRVRFEGRRKRRARKMANDLRLAAPLLFLMFCFAGSATAIVAAEWAPSHLPLGEANATRGFPSFANALIAHPAKLALLQDSRTGKP
jgi:hypothetical protein